MSTRTWKAVKAAKLSAEAMARVEGQAKSVIEEVTLQKLRQGFAVTQVELAEAAKMTQSELSRLESRADHRISTLRRYVEALGGELEITAVFRKHRVKLTDV